MTLGELKKLMKLLDWQKAAAWVDARIEEQGEDERILKDPSQVVYLMNAIQHSQEKE